MSKEFTYQDVAEHNTKKDIYVVIHDKVYDCSKFIDEHPYVLPTLPMRRPLYPSFFFLWAPQIGGGNRDANLYGITNC
jgi:hypothetical protein